MSKTSSASKIKLNSYDSLFGMNDAMTEAGNVRLVKLSELYPFPNHPFQVHLDARMEELIASIKANGVLIPGVARIRGAGGYEIIAGHSRKYACEKAGLTVMPMYIRNVSDDEATIIMVDSNIQREDILPSEKAKAYSMRYNAIKHQGKKGNSLDALQELSGESKTVIQRYIQLASLSDELLTLVDSRKIGLTPGVELSFLGKRDQAMLADYLSRFPHKVSIRQAEQIRDNKGKLSDELLHRILSPLSDVQEIRQIKLGEKTLRQYFPEYYSEKEIMKVIKGLLKQWSEAEGGQ